MFVDSMMSAIDVDVPGRRILVAGLRESHPDRRVRDRRAEDRHAGAVRRRQDAVVAGLLPQVAAEPVEELARRIRTPFERQRELGDPLVVLDELRLARVRVVDAVDAIGLQLRVVSARAADVVVAAARLVQIVIEVGARRDEAVDVAMLEQMRHEQAHPARAERARQPEKDRAVAPEHALPDAPRGSRDCVPGTTRVPCATGCRRPRGPARPRTAQPARAESGTCWPCGIILSQDVSGLAVVSGLLSSRVLGLGSCRVSGLGLGSPVSGRVSGPSVSCLVTRTRDLRLKARDSPKTRDARPETDGRQNARPTRPNAASPRRPDTGSFRHAPPAVNVRGRP